jgi:protein subunit release factor B
MPRLRFKGIIQRTQMITIANAPTDTRIKINLVGPKDITWTYICGSGKGGSARNKVHSGAMCFHGESGAQGRATDSRSLEDNKHQAFKRMTTHPKFKFWLARRLHEIESGETLEKEMERAMRPENLKIEVKNEQGQWIEESLWDCGCDINLFPPCTPQNSI